MQNWYRDHCAPALAAHAVMNPKPSADFGGPLGFVTADDVQNRKDQLNSAISSLDADIVKCQKVDAPTLSAWNDFLSSWRTFYADQPGFFSAGAQGRQASDYADQLNTWQDKIAKLCPLSGAPIPKQPDDTGKIMTAIYILGGIVVFAVVGSAVAPILVPMMTAHRLAR